MDSKGMKRKNEPTVAKRFGLIGLQVAEGHVPL